MLSNLAIDEEKLEPIEMWFYRLILRIPWTERLNNKEIMEKMAAEKKKTPLLRISSIK